MAITRPTALQIVEVAAELGMTLSAEQAAGYLTLMQPNFDAYDIIDAMPDNVPLPGL